MAALKGGRLNNKKFKEFAKQRGADLVGIASPERFDGAPPEMDPRSIFPEAKAIIVLGFRIPRGCFRGIEEGTYFSAYPSMGYYHINLVYSTTVLREVCLFLEDWGFEAVPVPNIYLDTSVSMLTGEKITKARKYLARGLDAPFNEKVGILTGQTIEPNIPVAPGRPAPDVLVHFRIAAVAAGLGEIGWSKVFLSPQFGPRQRLVLVITDAPLQPDPLFEGEICDRCMLCVQGCSAKAISKDEKVEMTIAGKRMEWGKLNEKRCVLGYTGGVPETSPFTARDFKLEDNLKDPMRGLLQIHFNRRSLEDLHHLGAIEGARGCIRACMIHLEETGRIQAKFHNPFRKKKSWWLGNSKK